MASNHMVNVEFTREVTSPAHLAGKVGEKKHFDAWHAQQLIDQGYARPVEDPHTGEPIVYPVDEPEKVTTETAAAKTSAVTAQEAQTTGSDNTISAAISATIQTVISGTENGPSDQAANPLPSNAEAGEGADARMGHAG